MYRVIMAGCCRILGRNRRGDYRLPAMLAVVLMAAGCGSHPATSPTSSLSPLLTGPWSGTYSLSCPDSPTCGTVFGLTPPSGPQPLSLVLDQTGAGLSGQINLSGWLSRVADVTGTIAPDGTISLQGGSTWPAARIGCQPAGGWQLASWSTRYDPQRRAMTGAFFFTTQKHLSSCYYLSSLLVSATDVSLARGATVTPPFQGHWQGSYHIHACTPVGWPSCYPMQAGDYPFDLTLTQSVSAVSGSLSFLTGTNALPVSGSGADGMTLALAGSLDLPMSGAAEILRLTSWSTTRDTIGRMQGSFGFIYEITWNSGTNRGRVWSSSYEAELRSVVLVPW
jgi:hypothetical protein